MLLETLHLTLSQMGSREIATERKLLLDSFAAAIANYQVQNKPIQLHFICTHNSRRSHLSQIWAQVWAHVYGLSNVSTYSGGTEATAVFPEVLHALSHQGFEVQKLSDNTNPIYALRYSNTAPPLYLFSKTLDHFCNPSTDFMAIMTCTSADVGCPFVPGANKRFAIPFIDPKVSDGTPEQAQTYRERSLQIANEWKYVFEQIVK